MSLTDTDVTDTVALDVLTLVEDFLNRLPDLAIGEYVKTSDVFDFCLDIRNAVTLK